MEIDHPATSNGLTLGMVALSGFGVLSAAAISLFLVLTALSDGGGSIHAVERALPILSLGWVSGLVGVILLVSLVQASARLSGKSLPEWKLLGGLRAPTAALVVLWPVALLGGDALSRDLSQLSLLLLPPCMLLAVGLPTWWLLAFARRGLSVPSHRSWGVAGTVAMVVLPLTMLVELVLILIGGVFLLGIISDQPQLVDQVRQLTRALTSGSLDLEGMASLFEPLLKNPAIVFLVISGLAVAVPLVEEMLKPLGLWFLARRGFSPQQGFVLGATSGATFALVESLATLSSISGEGWAGLVLGRAGTSLLHITCSGLVGWGLGIAWSRARYAQLAGLFLLAVVIHGAWNGFAQFLGLMPFMSRPTLVVENSFLNEAVVLVALAVILLVAAGSLFYANYRLNVDQAQARVAASVEQPLATGRDAEQLITGESLPANFPIPNIPGQSPFLISPEDGAGDEQNPAEQHK